MLLLLKDDREAFNSLYQEYHQPLYYNILKLTKDKDVAKDILQEVFITLWEKRLLLDSNQPVSSWLFAVSYYKSKEFLKKTLREHLAVKNNSELSVLNADEQDAHIKENRLDIIDKALNKLSPQKRKVLELCKLQGKSYQQAADELHISKHTVKEYLSLALSNLKDYIKVLRLLFF